MHVSREMKQIMKSEPQTTTHQLPPFAIYLPEEIVNGLNFNNNNNDSQRILLLVVVLVLLVKPRAFEAKPIN